tara:strand:- start:660 stop:899 length:240 start_codon:yes stop_codon:yes gene_type:complete
VALLGFVADEVAYWRMRLSRSLRERMVPQRLPPAWQFVMTATIVVRQRLDLAHACRLLVQFAQVLSQDFEVALAPVGHL